MYAVIPEKVTPPELDWRHCSHPAGTLQNFPCLENCEESPKVIWIGQSGQPHPLLVRSGGLHLRRALDTVIA